LLVNSSFIITGSLSIYIVTIIKEGTCLTNLDTRSLYFLLISARKSIILEWICFTLFPLLESLGFSNTCLLSHLYLFCRLFVLVKVEHIC
jgi:hypothetical protein